MLFFDLDGTLLDSNGIWLDIDVEFLGRHGIAPVPEDYTWYVAHHSAPEAARYTRARFGLPETPEEKLVCLADKFFSKSGNMREKSLEHIRKSMEKFGSGAVDRFDELCRFFGVH